MLVAIVSKGKGHHMFKLGAKRRRTKAEILEEQEEERLRQQVEDQKLAQIAALQAQLANVEQERNNNALAADILNKWRTEGRLRQNQDGEVSIIEESELPEGHPSKKRPQEAQQNMD